MQEKTDHRHCRRLYDPERGVRALISSDPDFEVVAEAGDGHEAIKLVEKLKPDLVLMDLSMPRMNGMEAIREIRKRAPETKIVVLTIHKTEEYILATLKAGADGYVLKDATHDELMMALKNVSEWQTIYQPGHFREGASKGIWMGERPIKSSNLLGDPYPAGTGDPQTDR